MQCLLFTWIYATDASTCCVRVGDRGGGHSVTTP